MPPQSDNPSAANIHDALTNVYEAGAALVDVFKRFENDKSERFVAMWAEIKPTWELLPVGRVTFAELDRQWMRVASQFDAKQAERKFKRASYLGRGLMASFTTVVAAIDRWFDAKQVAARQIKRAAYLVDDLMAEGPQPSTVLCDKLHELERGCYMQPWLHPIRCLPGKMYGDSEAYCRDYSQLPLDQVIILRGQWDKLTGLLDGSVHGDIRSGGSAADEDYRSGQWFSANTDIPASRLRHAASKERKNKRVRTKVIDGVICYSVADVQRWWSGDIPDAVKMRTAP